MPNPSTCTLLFPTLSYLQTGLCFQVHLPVLANWPLGPHSTPTSSRPGHSTLQTPPPKPAPCTPTNHPPPPHQTPPEPPPSHSAPSPPPKPLPTSCQTPQPQTPLQTPATLPPTWARPQTPEPTPQTPPGPSQWPPPGGQVLLSQ